MAMSRGFLQGHYLLGIEGLALLRAGTGRDSERIGARTEGLRGVPDRLEAAPYDEPRQLPAAEPADGYARWAAR